MRISIHGFDFDCFAQIYTVDSGSMTRRKPTALTTISSFLFGMPANACGCLCMHFHLWPKLSQRYLERYDAMSSVCLLDICLHLQLYDQTDFDR